MENINQSPEDKNLNANGEQGEATPEKRSSTEPELENGELLLDAQTMNTGEFLGRTKVNPIELPLGTNAAVNLFMRPGQEVSYGANNTPLLKELDFPDKALIIKGNANEKDRATQLTVIPQENIPVKIELDDGTTITLSGEFTVEQGTVISLRGIFIKLPIASSIDRKQLKIDMATVVESIIEQRKIDKDLARMKEVGVKKTTANLDPTELREAAKRLLQGESIVIGRKASTEDSFSNDIGVTPQENTPDIATQNRTRLMTTISRQHVTLSLNKESLTLNVIDGTTQKQSSTGTSCMLLHQDVNREPDIINVRYHWEEIRERTEPTALKKGDLLRLGKFEQIPMEEIFDAIQAEEQSQLSPHIRTESEAREYIVFTQRWEEASLRTIIINKKTEFKGSNIKIYGIPYQEQDLNSLLYGELQKIASANPHGKLQIKHDERILSSIFIVPQNYFETEGSSPNLTHRTLGSGELLISMDALKKPHRFKMPIFGEINFGAPELVNILRENLK